MFYYDFVIIKLIFYVLNFNIILMRTGIESTSSLSKILFWTQRYM